ncbi:MAG TPA: ABC transporter substrate-binding protein [Streptosporangiaceae bacterium]
MSMHARRYRRLLTAVSAAAAGVLLVAACSGGSSSQGSGKTGGTIQKGGTATFALPPGAVPNWILPFIDSAHSSIDNRNQFEYLMYRPLYFFGDNGQPVPNNSLSIANPPVFSNGNKTITITMKNYKWSNGEQVTATGVEFWLNMMAAEKSHWAYYVPGGIPDNLTSWKVESPTKIVLNLKSAFSPSWFQDNELSQITPLPMAWDMTSATSKGDCATKVSGCAAVWQYLYNQSKQVSTYGKSPLWKVVDGPWVLSSYQTTGLSVFKPNPSYSGPVKPRLSEFVETPFTTESAELNVLRSGQVSVGYLPTTDIGQKGLIQSSGYNMNIWVDAGINYFPYNFNNPTAGPIFRQLYFRQAFQHLINQPEYISKIFQGYASPTYGPVPIQPANPFVDSFEKANPYPFSVSDAKNLLTSHGWTVKAGSAAICSKAGSGAGECGAGVKAGTKLSFSLEYASGSTSTTQEMENLKSVASQVGIDLSLSQAPFDEVISSSVPCKPSQASCKWQLDNWGGGWSYSMDHFPNGDLIFGSGAGDNFGSYTNPQTDALIAKSDHVPGTISAVEDFEAKDLPAIFMPKADYQLTETKNNLHGVTPQEPTFNITPENWYFTSGS